MSLEIEKNPDKKKMKRIFRYRTNSLYDDLVGEAVKLKVGESLTIKIPKGKEPRAFRQAVYVGMRARMAALHPELDRSGWQVYVLADGRLEVCRKGKVWR